MFSTPQLIKSTSQRQWELTVTVTESSQQIDTWMSKVYMWLLHRRIPKWHRFSNFWENFVYMQTAKTRCSLHPSLLPSLWTPGYESYGEYSCEFQLQFIWFQKQKILEICPLPLRKTTPSIIVQYKVHELHSLLTVLMSVHNMTIAYCL